MVTVQNASAPTPIKTFSFFPPSENRNKLDDEHDALLIIFNTLGFRIIHFSAKALCGTVFLRTINSQPGTCHPTAPEQRLSALAKPRQKRNIL